FVVAVSRQLYEVQASLPALAQELGRLEVQARGVMHEYLGATRAPAFKLADLVQNLGAFALAALSSTVVSVANAILIVVLAYLLLCYRIAIHRNLQQLAVVNGWPGFAAMADRVTTIGQHYLFGLGCVVLIATALDVTAQTLV